MYFRPEAKTERERRPDFLIGPSDTFIISVQLHCMVSALTTLRDERSFRQIATDLKRE